jgi:hypothetical protein
VAELRGLTVREVLGLEKAASDGDSAAAAPAEAAGASATEDSAPEEAPA